MVEPQPTSTPSSSTTRPVWGILRQPLAVGTKPKPSEAITALECTTQPRPRRLPGWSTAPAWISQPSASTTSS